MKNSQFLATLFFSALAAAAPLKPRAIVTKYDVHVTTKIVYTTVLLEPGQAIPTAHDNDAVTSTFIPQFNEAKAKYTPHNTNTVVPVVPTPTPTPSPPPVVATPPASSSSSSSSVYVAPPPSSSSSTTQVVAAPSQTYAAPSASASSGSGSGSGAAGSVGEKHTGVRFSAISNYNDPSNPVQKIETYGGCATYGQPPEYKMSDAAGDMRVALDVTVPNFYDYCGKKIRLTNPDGRTAVATIVDKCPGCGADGGPYSLDLLEGVWDAVGGGSYANNVHGASWEIIG